jgi:membrane protease subunit HflK
MSNSSKIMIDVEGGNNLLYLPLDKLVTQGAAAALGRDDSNNSRRPVNDGAASRQRDKR